MSIFQLLAYLKYYPKLIVDCDAETIHISAYPDGKHKKKYTEVRPIATVSVADFEVKIHPAYTDRYVKDQKAIILAISEFQSMLGYERRLDDYYDALTAGTVDAIVDDTYNRFYKEEA